MTATDTIQENGTQKLADIVAKVLTALETGFASLKVPCATAVSEHGVFLRVSGCSIGLRISGSLEDPHFQPVSCKADLSGQIIAKAISPLRVVKEIQG